MLNSIRISEPGMLLAIVFLAAALDFFLARIGLDGALSGAVVYIASSMLTYFVLRNMVKKRDMNRRFSLLGVVPPVGLLFGFYLSLYR